MEQPLTPTDEEKLLPVFFMHTGNKEEQEKAICRLFGWTIEHTRETINGLKQKGFIDQGLQLYINLPKT